MPKFIDLTGKRFGRWTVIYRAENKGDSTMWHCKCDCGTERDVSARNLRKGTTFSCGCLLSEKMTAMKQTHGKRKSRLYNVWCNMKRRCYESTNKSYKHYGGRGITVCEEWLGENGFQHFWDWSYAHGYDDTAERNSCTLDRIDVNGNYEPSNCRWANSVTQVRNRTNTRYLTVGGVSKPLAEWADEQGVSERLVYDRVHRGWDAGRALTEAPNQMHDNVEYNGEIHSYSEWARLLGIKKETIQWRVQHGWTIEEIMSPIGTVKHQHRKGGSK